jgi:two-component system cell cycle sensor histidine kinase/response regulator CckA
LQRCGYRVTAVEDPAEALVHLTEHPGSVDLLLSDVVMPGLNGAELMARARALDSRLRVLFVSGYPRDLLDHRLPSGDFAYLSKPFGIDDLRARVAEVLED